MSSDDNKKDDEVLRLPDSMPDDLVSLGTPIAADVDVTPVAPLNDEQTAKTQIQLDEMTATNVDVTELTEETAVTALAEEPTAVEETTAVVDEPMVVEEPTVVTAEQAVTEEPTDNVVQMTAQQAEAAVESGVAPLAEVVTPAAWRFGKNTKRVALAAVISATGFVLTITWYNLGASGAHSSNSKAIAKIIRSVNEVQRKPITKLIWQPIFDKDIVYVGEAIRTASNAEATIEFLESGTKIDLDPDSAIVLEESAGKLALNFLQGNLLVKAGKGTGAGGAEDITLKTGEKQITLGNSELSLGKSSSGQLDLQVLKGQAQVMGDGKTVTLDQGKSLTGMTLALLKPTGDESIYIDTDIKEKVLFEWQQLTQGDYTVTLEAGPTRNSMKPVPGAMATGAAGKLEAELKVGRVYYRLVARSNDPNFKELASPVLKNMVIAKIPPLPISPENSSVLAISQDEPLVNFAWSNPANLSEVYMRVSRTPDFKTLVFEKSFKSGENTFTQELKTSGKYYWQLVGRAQGKNIALSKVAQFEVQITRGLPAPILSKPHDQEKVPYDLFKEKGLLLTWEQVANATKYRLVVESARGGSQPISVETELLQNRLKDLSPGVYSWSVVSLNEKGEASPNPQKRSFSLVELPLVPWADGKTTDEYQYITLKPSVELQWSKPAAPVVRYQIRLTDEATETPKSVATHGFNLTVPLETDGSYFAEVEGIDATGKIVARSQRRQVKVSSAPLLPPPQFAEGLPEEILANGSGAAGLQWQTVQGASKYVLILKDVKGEPKRELAFTSGEGQLRGLMPGDYKVVLRSVDQHGRPGPEGEERVLKVPNVSNVRAPKLKGLKVK